MARPTPEQVSVESFFGKSETQFHSAQVKLPLSIRSSIEVKFLPPQRGELFSGYFLSLLIIFFTLAQEAVFVEKYLDRHILSIDGLLKSI
jgi:hypothetical protein